MNNFDNFILAETDNEIDIGSLEDNLTAATRMVQQCTRSLDIISRLLDPPIFDSTEFIETIRQMVTKNRNPLLRIIVFDPEMVVKHGHQLVDLAGDLSSFIEIRKAHNQHKNYNECLLIADTIGYIHRNHTERYDATVNFCDKRMSKKLREDFDEIWATATQDPNLRRVHM